MENVWGMIIILFIAMIFWQQRRQSEYARQIIQQHCKKMQLQVISIAFGRRHFFDQHRRFNWHSEFCFEFSVNGQDLYNGKLMMKGFKVVQLYTPPHRMPDEVDH
ncbi:DUF3301 domain-containing protein [Vibrio sp. SS-MA-C1-2]|uniref:DUF3301 domain-containing protein n=1 Tax=Vibrio sp. SS-MA-C1-2 TaxID=2908646 RepID=UPI001F30EA15|nr:DUF3301 domain-containing protein [Vibrio sp. SS-MA-C1-2]UJF18909.1 DUF3301 domain-containing protein [Vibrio sp. SS-MA-C1-2]